MNKLNAIGASFTIMLLTMLVAYEALLLYRRYRDVVRCYEDQLKNAVTVIEPTPKNRTD